MEHYVSRASHLPSKGADFVVLPGARCWQGSGRCWSNFAERRFASRIFAPPASSIEKGSERGGRRAS
eukprot:15454534-Alexandrium_andersonii.AAC.1